MDHGLNGHCLKGLCPWDRRPPTRYISRLWAAITIQEYTRNWKDKKTHPVDCRATSPTRQERDSLKSQGRGWPRGPTWRLGISAGNAKVFTRTATWGKLAKFFHSRCLSRFLNNLYHPVELASLLYSYISFSNGNFLIVKEGMPSILLEPSAQVWGQGTQLWKGTTSRYSLAARRFLTLAGYDMKCVTPNVMKSKALLDLLAYFLCGEYEYAPPAKLSVAVLEEANKISENLPPISLRLPLNGSQEITQQIESGKSQDKDTAAALHTLRHLRLSSSLSFTFIYGSRGEIEAAFPFSTDDFPEVVGDFPEDPQGAAKQAFIKMIRDEVTRPTGEEMNRAIRAIFPFDGGNGCTRRAYDTDKSKTRATSFSVTGLVPAGVGQEYQSQNKVEACLQELTSRILPLPGAWMPRMPSYKISRDRDSRTKVKQARPKRRGAQAYFSSSEDASPNPSSSGAAPHNGNHASVSTEGAASPGHPGYEPDERIDGDSIRDI
ncbi:hypothetical protein Tco_1204756 [Tanacetum coccineum]